MHAAKKIADKDGKKGAGFVLKKMVKDVGPEGESIKESMKKPDVPRMMTPEEALAHMLLTDQTKENYKAERKLQKQRNALIYPDYNLVHELKEQCLPENIQISSDGKSNHLILNFWLSSFVLIH